MASPKILSLILALTKEVKFKSIEGGRLRKFLARVNGNGQECKVTWWITFRGIQLCNDISKLIKLEGTRFKEIHIESLSKKIEETLEKKVLDLELFHVESILKQNVDNLFEAKNPEVDTQEFANKLFVSIEKYLSLEITDWLIVYPARKCLTSTFFLGFEGLGIIQSNDHGTWSSLKSRYPSASSLDLITGSIASMPNPNKTCFTSYPPSSWFVCELSEVDSESALKAFVRRLRTFIAVLYSIKVIEVGMQGMPIRNSLPPNTYGMLFPQNIQKTISVLTSVGDLWPNVINDMTITPQNIKSIEEWYAYQRDVTNSEKNKRIAIASQFIHSAIVNNDEEQFMHFFIALDALFGVRQKVEASIIDGVSQVFNHQQEWREKAEELYDLRCALIHGGISEFEEWPRIEHYIARYKSRPYKDIPIVAMNSFVSFPGIN